MEKWKSNILKIYGKCGEEWLKGLTKTVEQLQIFWALSDLKPLSNLSYSYVLEGIQGELPVILKLSPDMDLIDREACALNSFKEFGAVSLIGNKKGALLLERAIPGDPLKGKVPKESRIEIACKIMEKLHQAPVLSEENFPRMEEWLAAIDKEWNLPNELLIRARKLRKGLIKKYPPKKVLLHGDFHQENILSKGSGWVVIDPKGVIGHPIHEIWACVEDISFDLKFLANYFNYCYQDVVEWYYVRLILAACWQVEDGLDPSSFLNLARSVLSI